MPAAAPAPEPVQRVKILTTGPHMSGKSCLIKHFCEGRFVRRYLPTIGVDYGVRAMDVDGMQVRVNFFDLSGLDEYLDVRREFYADSQTLLLVFDGSSRESFEQAERYYTEAVQGGFSPQVGTAFLVRTKSDLACAVPDAEVQLLATRIGAKSVTCSSCTGEGVAEALTAAFRAAVAQLHKSGVVEQPTRHTGRLEKG